MLENLKRKKLQKPNKQYYVMDLKSQSILWAIDRVYYSSHMSMLPKPMFTKKYTNSFFQAKSRIEKLDSIEFSMLLCPIGSFVMGNEILVYLNLKEHKIKRPFLLGETEVTQELYEKVMGGNNSTFENRPQNPADCVSWEDAILFCNELSRRQGLDLCYTKNSDFQFDWHCDFDKNGYRLPREIEWEYAAKASTKNRWAGTDDEDFVGEYAWYQENSSMKTQPVKTKKPNEWGFYDMSGNVKEWCWDKYESKNTKLVARRVVRGGDWYTEFKSDLQITVRNKGDTLDKGRSTDSSLGFRIARSIID